MRFDAGGEAFTNKKALLAIFLSIIFLESTFAAHKDGIQ